MGKIWLPERYYFVSWVDLIVLFRVVEGVGDFLASVQGAYEDEEGPAGDDEAEGAGGRVAFVVCEVVSQFWQVQRAYLGIESTSAGAAADLEKWGGRWEK